MKELCKLYDVDAGRCGKSAFSGVDREPGCGEPLREFRLRIPSPLPQDTNDITDHEIPLLSMLQDLGWHYIVITCIDLLSI